MDGLLREKNKPGRRDRSLQGELPSFGLDGYALALPGALTLVIVGMTGWSRWPEKRWSLPIRDNSLVMVVAACWVEDLRLDSMEVWKMEELLVQPANGSNEHKPPSIVAGHAITI